MAYSNEIGSLVPSLPVSIRRHINVKETYAILTAAKTWASQWSNHRVIIFCDNTTTVACLNKGSSSSSTIMKILRKLFWLSATHNFRISAIDIPGTKNILADMLSRYQLTKFFSQFYTPLNTHISVSLTQNSNISPSGAWQNRHSPHTSQNNGCTSTLHLLQSTPPSSFGLYPLPLYRMESSHSQRTCHRTRPLGHFTPQPTLWPPKT